jgi:hypothetical protein
MKNIVKLIIDNLDNDKLAKEIAKTHTIEQIVEKLGRATQLVNEHDDAIAYNHYRTLLNALELKQTKKNGTK